MDRLLRMGEGKLLKQLKGIANQVNAIEDDFVAMDDEELRSQTADFRARVDRGETLESLLPDLEPIATTLLYAVAVLTVSSGLDYVYRFIRSSGPASGNIPSQ